MPYYDNEIKKLVAEAAPGNTKKSTKYAGNYFRKIAVHVTK